MTARRYQTVDAVRGTACPHLRRSVASAARCGAARAYWLRVVEVDGEPDGRVARWALLTRDEIRAWARAVERANKALARGKRT